MDEENFRRRKRLDSIRRVSSYVLNEDLNANEGKSDVFKGKDDKFIEKVKDKDKGKEIKDNKDKDKELDHEKVL